MSGTDVVTPAEMAEARATDGLLYSRRATLLAAAARSRRLRRGVMNWCFRLEGGHFLSGTARAILAQHYGVYVGSYSYGECMLPGAFPAGVIVGRYSSFGYGVRVFLRNHPMDRLSTHPYFFNSSLGLLQQDNVETGACVIGHDVWIGESVLITPGCRNIGLGAVIGAGAVVTRDVPDFAVVAGNPARVLRYRFGEELRERIRKSRWWMHSIDDLRRHTESMVQPLGSLSHPLLRAPGPLVSVGVDS